MSYRRCRRISDVAQRSTRSPRGRRRRFCQRGETVFERQKRSLDIDLNHQLELVDRQLFERGVQHFTCIAENSIDPAEPFFRRGNRRGPIGFSGDVQFLQIRRLRRRRVFPPPLLLPARDCGPLTATSAPPRAKESAQTRPIPVVAPVTKITRCARRPSLKPDPQAEKLRRLRIVLRRTAESRSWR